MEDLHRFIILITGLIILSSIVLGVETKIAAEELRIDLIRYDPSLHQGSYSDVVFDITNVGDKIILSKEITLVDAFPFRASERSISITNLKPGEKVQVKFNVYTNKDVDDGVYSLSIQYYSDKQGAILTKSFDASVKKSLVIATTSVNIKPERLKPGDNADVEVILENSADSRLRDITISLDLDDVPFAPIGTTAERKIKELGIGKSENVLFKIIVNPDAESKIYKVPLKIRYIDELGKEFSKDEVIGIIVDEKPDYQIDLEESDVYSFRDSGEIVLSISNRGTAEIKFLTIGLNEDKSYKVISNPRVYVGNLESDDFETVSFTIYSKSFRDIPLNVNVMYKDSYNREYNDSIVVNLPIYSRFTAKRVGLVDEKSNLLRIIIFIILVIFVYKVYKEWRKERDIEKAVKNTVRNTIEYVKKKIKRKGKKT